MVDLINHIDGLIGTCLGRGQQYGLCRLIIDDSEDHYPATVATKPVRVTPEDKYSIMTYHRLLDGEFTDSETFSFGRTIDMENSQRVRMVVLIALSEGESVIDSIINALPDSIENVDYKSVVVGASVTLIRDRAAVWAAEYSNAYKDKYQLRFNIYAVEYSINYIKCDDCVAVAEPDVEPEPDPEPEPDGLHTVEVGFGDDQFSAFSDFADPHSLYWNGGEDLEVGLSLYLDQDITIPLSGVDFLYDNSTPSGYWTVSGSELVAFIPFFD